MATRNEKIIGSLLGVAAGIITGRINSQHLNIEKKSQWKYIVVGGLLGTFTGYQLSRILGTPNDTVNYKLLKGNKNVYHGITYEDRITARKNEHIRSGKSFNQMVVSKPKPRVEAHKIEKKLIRQDKPLYNIQHNN